MQTRANHLDQLLGQVARYKLPDGSVAFPELSGDPGVIDEIASVMVEFGKGPEDLATPLGVMQAVALYRMAKGFRTPPPSGSTTSPGREGAIAPPIPAPAAAASVGADNHGGGAPSGRPRGNGRLSGVLNAFDAMVAKPDETFNILGFHRNPRVSG
jgi:hypothetical protein